MRKFWQVKALSAAMFAVIVAGLAAGAMAQELPKIAIYMTGDFGSNEKKALGTRILFHLVNSGRYIGSERANSFAAEADKELLKHGRGIDDNEIGKLGKTFDIKFVCIADVTPAFGEFQVSARIIDVETAQTAFMGESASPLKSMNDLALVSDQVVQNMFAAQTAPPTAEPTPAPKYAPASEPPKPEPIAPPVQAAALPITTPPPQSPAPQKGPRKAAVYVTGIPAVVAKPLNSAISSALIKTKIYAGIEPIDVSGPPNTPALVAAGSNAGVSYIFAVNVSGAISVAIVDVAEAAELAKISIDGKITAVNAAVVAKKIVDFILKSGPKPDPDAQYAAGQDAPESGRSAPARRKESSNSAGFSLSYANGCGSGLAGIGRKYSYTDYDYYYDNVWSTQTGEEKSLLQWNGLGIGGFFDLTYVELSLGLAFGFGNPAFEYKEEYESFYDGYYKSQEHVLYTIKSVDISFINLNIGVLGKYPIPLSDAITLFPAAGIDYALVFWGQDKEDGGKTRKWDGKKGTIYEGDGRIQEMDNPKAGDFSALWFKFGAGLDIDMNDRLFVRSEALYGIRLTNKVEIDEVKEAKDEANRDYDGNYNIYDIKPVLGHGLTIKVGLGFRL